MTAQTISRDVLIEKYAKHGETSRDQIFRRVADALASVESPQLVESCRERFLAALQAGFIPAGRIMSAAGTAIEATLINCFVQPIGDSISHTESGKPGIYEALAESAEPRRRGGGVGYDFSRIRPRGARVRGTASKASGPISYMRVFDRSCETVESAGARRGAQMGVLRCDHPDVFEFVHAKDRAGELSNFNLSVGITDDFMRAVEAGAGWDLVHVAEPSSEQKAAGARRRSDGRWIYRSVPARDLFDLIMHSTYDHAEPGVLFLDRANADNNLAYCETFEACNPCAEQFLPDYGCCCLGSIDLTRFVQVPFTPGAVFDFQGFGELVGVAVRMLDNVLDASFWPLPAQRREAELKRRIGLGFTGLGDALVMLGLRYDTEEARGCAAGIANTLRDRAYAASLELAREKGPFPEFQPEAYLASGFASRLPETLREGIRQHGLRNSHLLSIAPTGTISLAFADNVSNGIEPPYSWSYTRRKRGRDGRFEEYTVEDHAYRLFREAGGDMNALPAHWVTALQIGADDHLRMLAAVQPYIDSSISKTVNVSADYPFDAFRGLYQEAWKAGLKGLATYRPNSIVGQVLIAQSEGGSSPAAFDQTEPDRRLRLEAVPEPVLASLRWRKRPRPPGGNPAWTYMVDHPRGSFALFVGHVQGPESSYPFEVWVNGAEQPRGLGALVKSLSMDMRSNDRGWLRTKLESLMKAHGDDGFTLAFPPDGRPMNVPSLVAGVARLIHHRCAKLGAFELIGETPVLAALMSPKEPKTGPDGTLAWCVDVANPSTADDFVLFVKELQMPDGQRRPYSVWLAGEYPRVFDGLCKSLSFDMRVLDPAWIGAKLRQLADFPEPRGDFLAKAPGTERQQSYPSTIAYLVRLLIHRYANLGILDAEGIPVAEMGMLRYEADNVVQLRGAGSPNRDVRGGRRCEECGAYAVVRRDGCLFCTACGANGGCG
ncbi:MAG: adenosylcobalamin-dependent ribonucleoside-diphosphate reductase [Methylotetracoccus sp.]